MIHTVWVMHSMNTCWMCIWHMFDRLMLTNVHWLVLHDWIKPAGWKQPDSKFIYKGRRALTQQKINKVRLHQYHIMYNRSFSNNLNFFHWKNSTMCKQNLAVSLFSTLKNQYQGLMKNVIDRPCHQGSFQNLNLTLNDLKKWPTVSPSTTWVNIWISQNCKNFLQPTQSLCWISKNPWALPAMTDVDFDHLLLKCLIWFLYVSE